MSISKDDYFKGYPGHPEITPAIVANAEAMLEKNNRLRQLAAADGVVFFINPATGTPIGGEKNGGWRPLACPVGAKDSGHKKARAVDNFDPQRDFASWCLANLDVMRDVGIHIEDPRWTFSVNGNHWLHAQDYAPGSGKLVFVPDSSAAKGPMPEAWS